MALAVYIKVLFTSCPKGHVTDNTLTNSWNHLSPTLFLNCHNFHSHEDANLNDYNPKTLMT